ncbi:MAG TPA: LysR substrate-binding domain-containing protein, partial [Aquabacterium sp.]|nr:LysR substrate-binding domain-containing protein [Aquabacterium sp.]
GLATESLEHFDDLVSLPAYEWQHVAVMRSDHPLAEAPRLTLEQLAAEPLISYHAPFTGRSRIDAAFEQRGLHPQVVLEALDADVIKTYTRLGLGIGLVAEMAVKDDPAFAPGGEMTWRPAGHLFGRNVTRVAFKRGSYLRQFVLTFTELLSERLTKAVILQALSAPAGGPGSSDSDVGL